MHAHLLQTCLILCDPMDCGPPGSSVHGVVQARTEAWEGWRQKEKGEIEGKIVGWHHQLSGHESEQTPGDGEKWEAWCAAVHGVTKSWTQLT